jgi:hypothetical protein
MRVLGVRWLALASAAASLACSTTSQKSDPGPCGAGFDGCVSASVGNTDSNAPFDPSNADRDGKGTFYAALIDGCPTAEDLQFGLVSEPAIIEVDFTEYQLQPFLVRYRFDEEVKEGDTAYLIGFLDDNSTVTDVATTAFPDFGDTFTTCVAIEMSSKFQNFTDFIEPCLLFDPKAPYAFRIRSSRGECDTSFLIDGGAGDGGANDSGAQDAAGSG